MKKLTATIIFFLMLIALPSCNGETYEDGYEAGYTNGLFEGECSGYSLGISKAQQDIAFFVDDDLSSLADDIERRYGMHPEDAMQILSNYADVPDEVDPQKVNIAIWVVYSYYYESQIIINSIEDYWID